MSKPTRNKTRLALEGQLAEAQLNLTESKRRLYAAQTDYDVHLAVVDALERAIESLPKRKETVKKGKPAMMPNPDTETP